MPRRSPSKEPTQLSKIIRFHTILLHADILGEFYTTLTSFDPERNILHVNQEIYDTLEPFDQRRVLRIHHSAASIDTLAVPA